MPSLGDDIHASPLERGGRASGGQVFLVVSGLRWAWVRLMSTSVGRLGDDLRYLALA